NMTVGTVGSLPDLSEKGDAAIVTQMIAEAKKDWDSAEKSWDFEILPLFQSKCGTLQESLDAATIECLARFDRMKELEKENNRLFIEAYGLEAELTPDVADDQITLYRPDRSEDIKRLLSYAIGCVMGRSSLDTPGL
ncbi:MAG: SAM-dependent methyltransferase, partial [Planctomyces sp.]